MDLQGAKKTTGNSSLYICLFHLKSSIWMESYRYNITVSNQLFYLDPTIFYIDWIPKFIYNDAKNLEKAIEKELRKKFVRLTTYEVIGVARTFLMDYQKIAEVYWRQSAIDIVQSQTFHKFINMDWKIFSGNYLGNINVVLQSENRR